jgi:hypothetical protein
VEAPKHSGDGGAKTNAAPSGDRLRSRFRRASILLYWLCAADVVHALTAIAMAPPHKRTFITIGGGGLLNIVVIALLIWCAGKLRRGSGIVLAVSITLFMGIGAIVAVTGSMAFGYTGSGTLLWLQGTFLLLIVYSNITLIRLLLLATFRSTEQTEQSAE